MPRYASITHTERKHVRLTPEARTTIQRWADREGLSFSAALEALAQRALRRTPPGAALWIPAAPPAALARRQRRDR
jgi:hypothetical protein